MPQFGVLFTAVRYSLKIEFLLKTAYIRRSWFVYVMFDSLGLTNAEFVEAVEILVHCSSTRRSGRYCFINLQPAEAVEIVSLVLFNPPKW